jgi:hypothetical protein
MTGVLFLARSAIFSFATATGSFGAYAASFQFGTEGFFFGAGV